MPATAMPAQTPPDPAALVARLDALLPQTQCGLCQTPGCRPYAEAIAAGEAINRCVPGGQATVDAIAATLGRPSEPVDTTHGVAAPHRLVALIREDECIGCTKCIQACPVDAIIGAAKLMHTVLIEECTGCNLCLPPCPVDCIDLVPGPDIPMTWHRAAAVPPGRIPLLDESVPTPAELAAKARADHARQRHDARLARLRAADEAKAARRREKQTRPVPAASSASAAAAHTVDPAALMIAAAMTRSQLKKAEKQLAALDARGEDNAVLRASLPALREAVTAAETALAAAKGA